MKRLALILALTTALPAQAGGPVVIEDEYTVAEPTRNDDWVIPVLILLGIAAIAAGGSDDPAPIAAPPVKPTPICYAEGC